MKKYPRVEVLKESVVQLDLSFDVIFPRQIDPSGIYDEEVKMKYKDQEFIVAVYNEYEDIELNNPVVFLDMILREVECFEENKAIKNWAFENAVKPTDRDAIRFYKNLKECAPKIRAIVGNNVKSIPYFDIELNTGIAKALRAANV